MATGHDATFLLQPLARGFWRREPAANERRTPFARYAFPPLPQSRQGRRSKAVLENYTSQLGIVRIQIRERLWHTSVRLTGIPSTLMHVDTGRPDKRLKMWFRISLSRLSKRIF